MTKKKSNMYSDSIYQWNIHTGCFYSCKYCIPSFQRQMKRQKPVIDKNGKKRGCQDCYDYIPHFHKERLNINFNEKKYQTIEDKFIWVGSSGDISFITVPNILKILRKIDEYPDRTFFFQTKNPRFFLGFNFPANVILGITLESNRSYPSISKAPIPFVRYNDFRAVNHPRKIVTIEPILQFDLAAMVEMIRNIAPERVYIGYDTKNCGLVEPRLAQTEALIERLEKFTKVKLKYIPEK